MFDRTFVWAVIGVSLLFLGIQACADSSAATYVGAAKCKNCHSDTSSFTGGSHPKTDLNCDLCHKAKQDAIVKAYRKSAHASALIDAEDSPSLIKAVFTSSSAVKKEEIAYIIGSGNEKQAYLDSKLKLLPAQWDVIAKQWIKTTSVDGGTQCVGCHVTGYNAKTRDFDFPGVACESCHGPGSLHAAAGDKTKIINPASLPKDRQAMVCGQCHSKGTDKTKVYAFPMGFKPGNDLTTLFVDAKPKAAGMNQQYSEMLGGKHLANGVGCVSCHDPHGPVAGTTHQLLKPVTDLCHGCHADKVLSKHAPGMPATTTCATCHMPGGSHAIK